MHKSSLGPSPIPVDFPYMDYPEMDYAAELSLVIRIRKLSESSFRSVFPV